MHALPQTLNPHRDAVRVFVYGHLPDFLILGPPCARASYTHTLGQLGRVLLYGGVPPKLASGYTLHSLNATLLSGAVQLDISETSRRILGHHRGRGSGERMADKYSRDDVVLALRAQLRIVSALNPKP